MYFRLAYLRCIIILFSRLCIGPPSDFFVTKTSYIHATYPTYLVIHDLIILKVFSEDTNYEGLHYASLSNPLCRTVTIRITNYLLWFLRRGSKAVVWVERASSPLWREV